ncbi:hypothetical protein B0T17DRAFT_616038 [Bombardia bombarda]|uniref:F-box domain-containing protein n=1 Tax=Bombardia bombarda TaxID=252184 RepID=A0AA39XAJ2_9PEZI|nr:hypothetical protein B0T17DRAFT_616038 [Bombardia bombarda]
MPPDPRMDSLPVELLLELPGYLDSSQDLASLARVNKTFHTLVNPVLYERDAQAEKPASVFWAAEQGSMGTLEHAHAAGAPLGQAWYSEEPRGNLAKQPYRHKTSSSQKQSTSSGGSSRKSSKKKDKKQQQQYPEPGIYDDMQFLDYLDYGDEMPPAPRYWWHPLDLAASNGHEDVVKFLADKGVSMKAGGSRGLCDGCGQGGEKVHYPGHIASCGGHAGVETLIDELGGGSGGGGGGGSASKSKKKGHSVWSPQPQLPTAMKAPLADDDAAMLAYKDAMLEKYRF